MAGIKTLEMDSTRENVYKTLVADSVGRNKNLWQFACFCAAQESRCSIALDSGWGTGKTFFLKQLQMLYNYSDLVAKEQNALKSKFGLDEENKAVFKTLKKHVCVYYDAWQNDNAEDPMRSILYSLICQTKHIFYNRGLMEYLRTACMIFDTIFGKNTTDFLDWANETNPVREIENQKAFQKAFASFLNKLIPKQEGRLLVLIDELDRCMPSYAVQLLERIKHYLSNDRITFVFAVNEEQLQHTITAIYGDGFEAHQYLDRFFDFRFSLPSPDYGALRKLLRIENLDENTWIYKSVCEAVIDKYSLTIREAIKYCQWVRIMCNIFRNQITNDRSCTLKLVIYIIIPIVYGLRIKNIDILKGFIEGKDISPLKKILENPRLRIFLRHPGVSYENTRNHLSRIDDDNSIPSLINDIYRALFQTPEDDSFPRRTPTFVFDKHPIEVFRQALDFMVDFIKYDTNTEQTNG